MNIMSHIEFKASKTLRDVQTLLSQVDDTISTLKDEALHTLDQIERDAYEARTATNYQSIQLWVEDIETRCRTLRKFLVEDNRTL